MKVLKCLCELVRWLYLWVMMVSVLLGVMVFSSGRFRSR